MRIVRCNGLPPNKEGIIYCGRAWAGWFQSLMANLHPTNRKCGLCGVFHTPQDTISCFKDDLWERMMRGGDVVLDFLYSLPEDAVLGCWCVDKDEAQMVKGKEECHCEVVIRASRWIKEAVRKCKEQGCSKSTTDEGFKKILGL